MTFSDPADGLMFRGGAIELGLNAFWTLGQSLPQLPKVIDNLEELAAAMSTTIEEFDSLATKGYWELPAASLPAVTRLGQPDSGVHRGLENPETTEECRVAGHHDQVTVPSLNIGGWYDVFQQGTLDNYIGMRARGVPAQLVVGPWQHAPTLWLSGQVGDANFGALSDVPVGASSISDFQLDWFENHLGAEAPAWGDAAPVKIFVMGINQWREEPDWPLQRAVATPLFLHGDGRLSFDQPPDEQSHSDFVYDPNDPVPTCGGNIVMARQSPAGPKDQSAIESRPDVLVFTTAAFTEDLEITGRVKAEIFAATDGPTTDWVVRLCDVDENGRSLNVVDGIARVSTEPDRIEETEVDLWSTSIVIKAGHRLRVQVSSSNFPRWDRNPNTDSEVDDPSKFRVAQQTIYHDAQHLSRLVLPVVPS
jgi:putative CocE/NonD family hydrolase